jgi:MULE transposase domain
MNTWMQWSGILTGSLMEPSSAPDIFYQLFTVHVFKEGSIVLISYALLPNKQRATYERMLTAINTMRNFDPTTVTCDFEMTSIDAVQAMYPRVLITGCFFHFSQ